MSLRGRPNIILAIDTSSAWCSVSVEQIIADSMQKAGAATKRGTITTMCDEAAGNHFEQLSKIVDRSIAAAKIELSAVSKIVVGTGPGSFTGLRIAMSFAKGLSWSLGVPLSGISSFEAAARATEKPDRGHSCVVSDARRGELFWQCFDGSGRPLSTTPDVRIGAIEDLPRLAAAACAGIEPSAIEFLTTDRVAPLVPGVEKIEIVAAVSEGLLHARIGADDDENGFSVAAVSALAPQYVRAVAAQTIEERSQRPR